MQRRDFLKKAAAVGAGAMLLPQWKYSQASTAWTQPGRIVVQIMLPGGPDFRHLIAPPYDGDENSYGYQYWKHRYRSHSIDDSERAWQNCWNQEFLDTNQGFGFWKGADWLKSMWDNGNVAIVANAYGSNSRDHFLGQLVMDHGDSSTGAHDVDKSGWGGRLAAATNSKVVSLTSNVRPFCYGPHPTSPNKHSNERVINFRDSRDTRLFDGTGLSATSDPMVMNRALAAYYEAKRRQIDANAPTPYDRFLRHEAYYRDFGDQLYERLLQVDIPAEISALYEGNSTLNNIGFGKQIRNLYDALACNDIIGFRAASMSYGGWDTHKNQKRFVEQRFLDLFGNGQGLDSLYQSLSSRGDGTVADQLVFVIVGEFGRQLKANGDAGTDHGRGNYVLMIGNNIAGGVHGDMFPDSELNRLSHNSPDISGLTSIEHIFGAIADWVEPGSSATVFGNPSAMPLETGVNITL